MLNTNGLVNWHVCSKQNYSKLLGDIIKWLISFAR